MSNLFSILKNHPKIALGLFGGAFALTLLAGYFRLQSDQKTRCANAIQAVTSVRGYQGLSLDSKGIASLLINILEKEGDLFVSQIELQRSPGQSFGQEFKPASSQFADLFFTRVTTSFPLEDFQVQIRMLFAVSTFFWILLISLLNGILASAIGVMALEFRKRHEEILVARKLEELALQIAHDIRSPLAALNSITSQLAELPEENRILIRSAVNRITDIANNLLNRKRAQAKKSNESPSPESADAPSTQLLSSLIDTVVSEKREQYRSRIGLLIEAPLSQESYGLFSDVVPRELKRVLSNLINNAAEALPAANGKIQITLTTTERGNEIRVQDNGKGIPPEILPKLFQMGSTHGKKEGSGIGLYHARKRIQEWGGSLELQSTVGGGTCVTLCLPQAQSPAWFIPKLTLDPKTAVVILDDDSSIHSIWRKRFAEIQSEIKLQQHSFSTPAELRSYVQHPGSEDTLFLLDYELLGFSETGLLLIEDLQIASQSVLVTSRFEEGKILKRCQELEVKLLPKGMAPFVPLEIIRPVASAQDKEKADAILIDDDELIHVTWKMAATRSGKKLKSYLKPDLFLQEAATLDPETPVFLDSNLGGGVRGEDSIPGLRRAGFLKIYLATGYDADRFGEIAGCLGVVDKNPPSCLMA